MLNMTDDDNSDVPSVDSLQSLAIVIMGRLLITQVYCDKTAETITRLSRLSRFCKIQNSQISSN